MFKLRFWWVLFWAWLSHRHLTVGRLRFWVTPFDCDINLHCNNASYLKYMDLGRWDFVVRLGLLKIFYRAQLHPVATRVEIDFLKAMAPGTFFILETRFSEVEKSRATMTQTFYVGEGMVAKAKVWVAFVKKGRSVKMEEVGQLIPPEIKELFSDVQ